jgi:hypothetical protein
MSWLTLYFIVAGLAYVLCWAWILGWPRRTDIYRGPGDLYLQRWHLIETRWFELMLHRFWRSDHDTIHDHPWAFWSLILRGGYSEVTPGPNFDRDAYNGAWRWYGPGSLLRRPAEWKHRVVITDAMRGRVWTLVWTGAKVRQWGFWCPTGWIPWTEHNRRRQRTGEGCP